MLQNLISLIPGAAIGASIGFVFLSRPLFNGSKLSANERTCLRFDAIMGFLGGGALGGLFWQLAVLGVTG